MVGKTLPSDVSREKKNLKKQAVKAEKHYRKQHVDLKCKRHDLTPCSDTKTDAGWKGEWI